jgi:S1-C subfamily serine protease
VRIDRVAKGSIAESAGLRDGDVIVLLAGATVETVGDVQRVISLQAPGTWLPIRVRRDGAELEMIAKFPPQ